MTDEGLRVFGEYLSNEVREAPTEVVVGNALLRFDENTANSSVPYGYIELQISIQCAKIQFNVQTFRAYQTVCPVVLVIRFWVNA